MSSHEVDSKLTELLDKTTITSIEDASGELICGVDVFDLGECTPNLLVNKNLRSFQDLTPKWESIWASFGSGWSQERQLFRHLFNETRGFFQSYENYRYYLSQFRGMALSDKNNAHIMNECSLNGELALRSMYEYAKQSGDILEQIDPQYNLVRNATGESAVKFFKKISGTRNTFLTHYHNPYFSRTFSFDPEYWNAMGSSQLFSIKIHLVNQKERYAVAFVNQHDDYFTFAELIINSVSSLPSGKH